MQLNASKIQRWVDALGFANNEGLKTQIRAKIDVVLGMIEPLIIASGSLE